MYRYERKRLIVSILIMCILGLNAMPLLSFITQARDPDFQKAILRAKETGLSNIDRIAAYPFFPVQRQDASIWFAEYARSNQQPCIQATKENSRCALKDTITLAPTLQQSIQTACNCQYLMGNGGFFEPGSYLSKASSIVALLRGIYGPEPYPLTPGKKYRDLYVSDAYRRGITKSDHIEYLQYIVTHYEFLLMLRRADQQYQPTAMVQ